MLWQNIGSKHWGKNAWEKYCGKIFVWGKIHQKQWVKNIGHKNFGKIFETKLLDKSNRAKTAGGIFGKINNLKGKNYETL